jgi:hypothetical protein
MMLGPIRMVIYVQPTLRVVGGRKLASTGVATIRRLLDAALVPQRGVVVRPQALAQTITYVWTTKKSMALIAREVPLQPARLARRRLVQQEEAQQEEAQQEEAQQEEAQQEEAQQEEAQQEEAQRRRLHPPAPLGPQVNVVVVEKVGLAV